MASISRDPGGRKRILFIDPHGDRKVIRLGECSLKQATAFKVKLETLVVGRITGIIDDETARWLAELPARMYDRLVALGLAEPKTPLAPEPEEPPAPKVALGELIDSYLRARDDLKPSSLLVYEQARRCLIDFFGADRPLESITPFDADEWRRAMVRQGLSRATIHKRCAHAKVFYRAAIRQRLVQENPFHDLKSSSVGNAERQYFVTRQETERVLAACPDDEWRLIVALCRYGGLRCPSEVLALRWQDVNWEAGRLTIHSVKTEHHEGKQSRVIPMFPEIRCHLMTVFEQAEPGAEHVITRYRRTNVNLRTQLHRIICKAGLKVWSRTFQNLRASRETELAETYPLHVCAGWLGHSGVIASKHYLTITQEHFDRATETAQNTAQSGTVRDRTGQEIGYAPECVSAELPSETAIYHSLQPLTTKEDSPKGIRTPVAGLKTRCPRPA